MKEKEDDIRRKEILVGEEMQKQGGKNINNKDIRKGNRERVRG